MASWQEALELDRAARYRFDVEIIWGAPIGSFPAPLSYRGISEALDLVAWALAEEALDTVDRLADAGAPELHEVTGRLRRRPFYPYRQFLVIGDVRHSSLLFEIFLVGGAYYILDKTIGATIGEAWKTTHTHTRLKELLRADVGGMLSRMRDRMETKAHKWRRRYPKIRLEEHRDKDTGFVSARMRIHLPDDIQ